MPFLMVSKPRRSPLLKFRKVSSEFASEFTINVGSGKLLRAFGGASRRDQGRSANPRRTHRPYSISLTPALCVSQERRRFYRTGVSARRQHKAAMINLWNGSQRCVTDYIVLPRNGFAQTAERPACFVPNGSLRCSSKKLTIRTPLDEARPTFCYPRIPFPFKESQT